MKTNIKTENYVRAAKLDDVRKASRLVVAIPLRGRYANAGHTLYPCISMENCGVNLETNARNYHFLGCVASKFALWSFSADPK